MDFTFFERLSPREARQYLERFLEVERTAFSNLQQEAEKTGLSCDYKVESIPALFEWIAKHSSIERREPDPSIPSWIRETESYSKGLFDLTEQTAAATMRAAFYLGEAFIRSFPSLEWEIGNPDFAQQNQPVVKGFKAGMEMPVLMVSENIVRGLISGESRTIAERAVRKWESLIETD